MLQAYHQNVKCISVNTQQGQQCIQHISIIRKVFITNMLSLSHLQDGLQLDQQAHHQKKMYHKQQFQFINAQMIISILYEQQAQSCSFLSRTTKIAEMRRSKDELVAISNSIDFKNWTQLILKECAFNRLIKFSMSVFLQIESTIHIQQYGQQQKNFLRGRQEENQKKENSHKKTKPRLLNENENQQSGQQELWIYEIIRSLEIKVAKEQQMQNSKYNMNLKGQKDFNTTGGLLIRKRFKNQEILNIRKCIDKTGQQQKFSIKSDNFIEQNSKISKGIDEKKYIQ
ncbi:unnamed protein product [Paramecium octaurelia]|uniref:Uncharacterized protein n=1 Tax=Paramecium octaurelia TaxID=43137 RepID=A0A8S1U0G9_PAROT|nr:unnamed protein product [Paramecium octaurelia]